MSTAPAGTTPTGRRSAGTRDVARGPRSARRRTTIGVAASAVLVSGGVAVASLGGAVAPATAAAATCRTPTPKVTNAGAARAAVERLARRVGTTTTKRPKITSPSSRPPAKLIEEDVVSCSGRKVRLGDQITVRYSLVNWGGKSRTVDSSWTRGSSPVQFPLQKGALVTGWTQGIPGMTVGSRRLLVVPPSKGYGRQGTSGVPASTTLIFVIDLVKIG